MQWARLSFLSVALAMSLVAAFVPERWLHRQRITAATPVTRFTLDRAAYEGAAADLADLRIVRDGLAEVPYLLTVAEASRRSTEAPVRLINKETRAGTLYATLELDQQADPHNELELQVTREDFRSALTIEASDDARVWATVRQSAYIFRYRTDDGRTVEHTRLGYPDSRRRYLRLAMANWPDPAQFTGATLRRDTSSSAQRSVVWTSAGPAASTLRNRTTCTVLDTGTRAPRDTATLSVAATPRTFHRSVTLEQSADGKAWSWLGAAAIYRIAGEELLTITFPETQLPYQRLCVFQGDDEAVRLERVEFRGIDRVVTFRAEAGGTYWLYSGAARAARPEYDLTRTAGEEFLASAQAGGLGAREANPAYAEPAKPVPPFSERYPAVLYGALALAVGGLGWMALRLLRPSA